MPKQVIQNYRILLWNFLKIQNLHSQDIFHLMLHLLPIYFMTKHSLKMELSRQSNQFFSSLKQL